MLYALFCSRLPFGDEELKAFVKNETPKKLMFTKNVGKGNCVSSFSEPCESLMKCSQKMPICFSF